jgi:hypothetical protein
VLAAVAMMPQTYVVHNCRLARQTQATWPAALFAPLASICVAAAAVAAVPQALLPVLLGVS